MLKRVSEYTYTLAKQLNVDEDVAQKLKEASKMYDMKKSLQKRDFLL
jgi:response regulator RpfG family c-di-GMP phosphodiesterase